MGRFGFNKKTQEGEDDSNRLALFGSRSKSKSPAPQARNPYAAAATAAQSDPYAQQNNNATANPYAQSQFPSQTRYESNGGVQSRSQQNGYANSYGSPQDEKSPDGPETSAVPNGRSKYTSPDGYRADRYGDGGGYGAGGIGSNPYSDRTQGSKTSRQGGYGGLGKTRTFDSTNTDANRDALFQGAQDRVSKQQQDKPPGYTYTSPTGEDDTQSYGPYGDRQLTAEEEEEEDVKALKQDIRFMKQQDSSTLDNVIRMMEQVEETGRSTLDRVVIQGERLYNTEKNLDLSDSQMRRAHDNIDDLNRANRSMFVPMHSPFTQRKFHAKREDRRVQEQRDEAEQRESIRRAEYQNTLRRDNDVKRLDEAKPDKSQASLATRSKYQMEPDSEDELLEDQIDEKLDIAYGHAKRVNLLGKTLGREIERQNNSIDRIGLKSDAVQSDLTRHTERLKRIQ